MKKLILSAALLAGMTFVACSSDDDKGGNCKNCKVTFEEQTETFKVCKNSDGNATVGGQDTGFEYEEYIDMMCDN